MFLQQRVRVGRVLTAERPVGVHAGQTLRRTATTARQLGDFGRLSYHPVGEWGREGHAVRLHLCVRRTICRARRIVGTVRGQVIDVHLLLRLRVFVGKIVSCTPQCGKHTKSDENPRNENAIHSGDKPIEKVQHYKQHQYYADHTEPYRFLGRRLTSILRHVKDLRRRLDGNLCAIAHGFEVVAEGDVCNGTVTTDRGIRHVEILFIALGYCTIHRRHTLRVLRGHHGFVDVLLDSLLRAPHRHSLRYLRGRLCHRLGHGGVLGSTLLDVGGRCTG